MPSLRPARAARNITATLTHGVTSGAPLRASPAHLLLCALTTLTPERIVMHTPENRRCDHKDNFLQRCDLLRQRNEKLIASWSLSEKAHEIAADRICPHWCRYDATALTPMTLTW